MKLKGRSGTFRELKLVYDKREESWRERLGQIRGFMSHESFVSHCKDQKLHRRATEHRVKITVAAEETVMRPGRTGVG